MKTNYTENTGIHGYRLYLEKTKVKLYDYASETPIPIAGKFKAVFMTGSKVIL